MALKDLHGGTVILIDAEFTCWQDSLATGWSDPARAAEMLEVAMISYDAVNQKELASFSSLVKPRLNPILSAYCLNILPIHQIEIDDAPEFEQVMAEITTWLSQHTDTDSPTAAWGKIDRGHTAVQATRCNIPDPFGDRRHIEVDELVKTALDIPTKIEREDVRKALNTELIKGRHRALTDAADLIAFDFALANRGK